MNHPLDQDLLLYAHRALSPLRSFAIRKHVARCDSCRNRIAELNQLSVSVASAVRVGMPKWRPAGVVISSKLLFLIILLAAGLLGFQVFREFMPPPALHLAPGPAICKTKPQSLPPSNKHLKLSPTPSAGNSTPESTH